MFWQLWFWSCGGGLRPVIVASISMSRCFHALSLRLTGSGSARAEGRANSSAARVMFCWSFMAREERWVFAKTEDLGLAKTSVWFVGSDGSFHEEVEQAISQRFIFCPSRPHSHLP